MSSVAVPSLYVNRLSQLWVRKQLTYFRLYDTSRSGVVTHAALNAVIAQRAREHLCPKTLPKLEPIVQHSWRIMWVNPQAESTEVESVHWLQFLQNRFHAITDGATEEHRALSDMADAIIAAGELSHGTGSPTEDGLAQRDYIRLVALYGLGEKDAKSSFKVMDQNRDGVVSQNEFRLGLNKFFFSPDKDESSMLFGHLAWDDLDVVDESDTSRYSG